MTRPGPHHIGTKGAADGYILVYRRAADEYVPEPLAVPVVLLEPLTTEIGGVPDLVWDDDNKLVMTEAS